MIPEAERPLRLFFAVPVPAPVRDAAARIQAQARPLKAACVPLEGLHLTLAFLGAQPAARVPVLEDAARRVAAAHAPFTLATAGLGGFPRLAAPRVLYLGLRPEPALDALVADLRAALAARAVPFDPGPFRPHLTLARLKRPVDLTGLENPGTALAIPVREIILYLSTLSATGSRYSQLGAGVLGGGSENQAV